MPAPSALSPHPSVHGSRSFAGAVAGTCRFIDRGPRRRAGRGSMRGREREWWRRGDPAAGARGAQRDGDAVHRHRARGGLADAQCPRGCQRGGGHHRHLELGNAQRGDRIADRRGHRCGRRHRHHPRGQHGQQRRERDRVDRRTTDAYARGEPEPHQHRHQPDGTIDRHRADRARALHGRAVAHRQPRRCHRQRDRPSQRRGPRQHPDHRRLPGRHHTACLDHRERDVTEHCGRRVGIVVARFLIHANHHPCESPSMRITVRRGCIRPEGPSPRRAWFGRSSRATARSCRRVSRTHRPPAASAIHRGSSVCRRVR